MSSIDIRTILWDGGKLNADLFVECQKKNILVVVQYNVRKSETKRLDLSRVQVMLDSITAIGAPARQSLLLCFDGYDDDRRELAQVPEVVAYVKRVVELYQHIWYFIHPEANQHIFTCTVPHTLISSPLLFTPAKKLVQLDIPAANKQLSLLSEAVCEYGKRIGDEHGARATVRQWRETLNI